MLIRGEIMEILIESLHEDLHNMVDIIGIDNFIKIVKIYGGSAIYIPTYKTILIQERNKNIIKEYDGSNINYLRKKYNLTNSQIRKLLQKK